MRFFTFTVIYITIIVFTIQNVSPLPVDTLNKSEKSLHKLSFLSKRGGSSLASGSSTADTASVDSQHQDWATTTDRSLSGKQGQDLISGGGANFLGELEPSLRSDTLNDAFDRVSELGNQVSTTIPISIPINVPIDTVTSLPIQGINDGARGDSGISAGSIDAHNINSKR